MKKVSTRYRKVIVHDNSGFERMSEDIQTAAGKFNVVFGEEQELNEYVIEALKDAVPTVYRQSPKERYPRKFKKPMYTINYLSEYYDKAVPKVKKPEAVVEDIPVLNE